MLDPPGASLQCTFANVRYVREGMSPEYGFGGPVLFLTTCKGSPNAKVSSAFLGEDNERAIKALEVEAARCGIHIIVVVIHTGKDQGLDEELHSWKMGMLSEGRRALDVLVISGTALAKYLPALAQRPDLLSAIMP